MQNLFFRVAPFLLVLLEALLLAAAAALILFSSRNASLQNAPAVFLRIQDAGVRLQNVSDSACCWSVLA